MNTLRLSAPSTALALVLFMTGQAYAQTASPQDDQANSTSTLDEVVVTAQRRSERTQDVPAAITAFGAQQLTAQNVTGVETIARRTPGFYLGSSGALRPALYIRGVGNRQADAGSESPVGVFLDDVYLGRSSSALGTLKDIERMEILRGPQGTLYGRNTIGGAVNVISKSPTREPEGRFELGASEYAGWNAMAAFGGPIAAGGDIRGRLAIWRDWREGYFTNLTTGDHDLGTDNFGARARVDFDLAPQMTLGLIADYSKDGSGAGFNAKRVGNVVNPNAVFLARAGLTPVTSPDRFAEYYNYESDLDREVWGLTGRLTADLGSAEFTSISSVRGVDAYDFRDVDSSSLDAAKQTSEEGSTQFTQEFRLASNTGGIMTFNDRVQWLVGGFYYHDESDRSDLFELGRDSVVGLLPTLPVTRTSADYTSESYALFGQLSFKPIETFELTLGGRYSHDLKTAVVRGANTIPGTPLVAVPFETGELSRSWSSFDPKIVATYRPTPDVNIYASYSKGFKSGGFQFSALSDAQARLIYDPEHLEAFEAGIKTRILNGRGRFNVAAYHYNYEDLQVTRNIPQPNNSVAVLVTNAGTSEINGVDVEFAYRPASDVEIGVTYNYLDGKYTDYVFAPAGIPVTAANDFSNTRLPRSPENSASGYVEGTIPNFVSGSLTVRADYSYRSRFFFEPGEGNLLYGSTLPLTVQQGYGLLDLRATYKKDAIAFSVYVDNATNEEYLRNIQGYGSVIVQYPGSPRLIGALLAYNF